MLYLSILNYVQYYHACLINNYNAIPTQFKMTVNKNIKYVILI